MSAAQHMPVEGELLTYEEAATRLGISVQGVRAAVRVETLVPVLVRGHKFLRVEDVDTYHQRKGRPGGRQRAWQQAPDESQHPTSASNWSQAQVSPEKIIDLAERMAAMQTQAAFDAPKDAIAGSAAGNAALLLALMGDRSVTDPKSFAASLTR